MPREPLFCAINASGHIRHAIYANSEESARDALLRACRERWEKLGIWYDQDDLKVFNDEMFIIEIAENLLYIDDQPEGIRA